MGKTSWTSVPLDEQMSRIPANAHKQRAIVQYFVKHPEPVMLSELLTALKATRSSVMRLVEAGILVAKFGNKCAPLITAASFRISRSL